VTSRPAQHWSGRTAEMRAMTDAPTESGGESAWAKLRRRKVVQWGVVYVAVAWGFLQGLEYISESFNWPQQVRQIALLVLIIGLPIVLVLAWYHGDRGAAALPGHRGRHHRAAAPAGRRDLLALRTRQRSRYNGGQSGRAGDRFAT
jgi:hypothetical protein